MNENLTIKLSEIIETITLNITSYAECHATSPDEYFRLCAFEPDEAILVSLIEETIFRYSTTTRKRSVDFALSDEHLTIKHGGELPETTAVTFKRLIAGKVTSEWLSLKGATVKFPIGDNCYEAPAALFGINRNLKPRPISPF